MSLPPQPGTQAPPELVIDTNVVLDMLVFRDPHGVAVGEALTAGRYRWVACASMRNELERALRRQSLQRWAIDRDAAMARYDALATACEAPPALGAGDRLRCTDPDDQPFVDLAIARRVRMLLSRDRAVLRLAKRAKALGVAIASPASFPSPRPV